MNISLLHVGGRTDLPVPLSFFVVGAGLAIVVSFVMLSSNWLEPRLQTAYHRKPIASRWPAHIRRAGRALGLTGLVLVVVNGIFDGDGSTRAIAPVLVWIVFWLAIPFASAVVGGLWRAINPYRWIVITAARGVPERPSWLESVGLWPATTAFLAFVWFELVFPDNTTPPNLAAAAVSYGAYLVFLGRIVGPNTALKSGDAFETYTGVISRIAPLDIGTDAGAAHRRPWLAALPSMPIGPGTTAFVIAMIGSVTYDGMSGAGWWSDLTGDIRTEMWFETAALLGTVAAIGVLYYGAAAAAGRIARSAAGMGVVADSFAHTLVPIAFAYAFAHYFTLIIFEGQQLLHNASDPFGRGWDLFGTADWRVVFASSQTWVWYVQVAVIVIGHIAGVVLAHDRALADFGGEVAVRTQYAMLVLMVALTSIGLFILAG